MRERPLPFSAPMIRAVLDGSKTQTRRLFKFPKWADESGGVEFSGVDGGPAVLSRESGCFADASCRYGVIGDQLWAREAWAYRLDHDHLNGTQLYDAGIRKAWYWADGPGKCCNTGCAGAAGRVRSSRFMPRWASRITLRITDVRVERLQEISEADALAEGIQRENVIVGSNCYGSAHHEETADRYFYEGCIDEGYESAADAYCALWEEINGAGSWALNPWVWAISFLRVTP